MSARLVEALRGVLRWMPVYPPAADCVVGAREAHHAAVVEARAALAEAEAPTVAQPVAKITATTPNGGAVEWLLHQGEPVDVGQELYAAPQPVPLSPLTDAQISAFWSMANNQPFANLPPQGQVMNFARAVLAAAGAKS